MALIALAIVASTAIGVAAERRWGERAQEASRRTLLGVLYLLLPLITFFNLSRAEFDSDVGVGVLLGYVALGTTVAIAYLVCTRLLDLPRRSIGSVLCVVVVSNTGYLGYPATVALLGKDNLSQAVIYDVVVSGPALIIGAFSIGAAFGDKAGEGARQRIKAFFTRNPVLYAALLALVAPDSLSPDVLVHISRDVVIALLPIGFIALGISLASEAEEGMLPFPPPLDRAIATAVAMRFLITPTLLFLLAMPLIDLPGPYLLQAAMPCGINSLIVTHAYGLDLRITSAAVAWSTAIAVVAAGIAAIVA
jgi:predicted permease